MLSIAAAAVAGAVVPGPDANHRHLEPAAYRRHARHHRRVPSTRIQTTLYALAAHVYPTTVRATGVGTAVAFGRVGGVMSTYAGEWALAAGGSTAFFALMAGAMAVVFICLTLVSRHVPRPER